MNEYPKALYKGDTVSNDFAIANDAEHEAELRDDGYVDYKDLPQGSEQSETLADGDADIDHELNKALDRIEQLENELSEALQANVDLEARLTVPVPISILQPENAELKKRLRVYEVNDLSADELRAILVERKVEHTMRDNKQTLVEAVLKSE